MACVPVSNSSSSNGGVGGGDDGVDAGTTVLNEVRMALWSLPQCEQWLTAVAGADPGYRSAGDPPSWGTYICLLGDPLSCHWLLYVPSAHIYHPGYRSAGDPPSSHWLLYPPFAYMYIFDCLPISR